MEQNMNNITTTFCLPIKVHRKTPFKKDIDGDLHTYITGIVKELCEECDKKYQCQIFCTSMENSNTIPSLRAKEEFYEFNYCITISGTINQVMTSRGHILRNTPSQCLTTLCVERWLLLDQNEEVKASIIDKFQDIMKQTKSNIIIDYKKNDKVKPPPGLGLDTIKIEVFGQWDSIEKAKTKCLLYFDELCGFSICYVEIDPKLHYILAGRKRNAK